MRYDRNKFVCPKCTHEFEDDGIEYPVHGDTTTIYCPECEYEFEIQLCTDYWFEQNESEFASDYLLLRGYRFDKEKTTWGCLGNYLERFMDGNKDKVAIWTDPHFENAYDIITEYIDKEPVIILCPDCNKETDWVGRGYKCSHCGAYHKGVRGQAIKGTKVSPLKGDD